MSCKQANLQTKLEYSPPHFETASFQANFFLFCSFWSHPEYGGIESGI